MITEKKERSGLRWTFNYFCFIVHHDLLVYGKALSNGVEDITSFVIIFGLGPGCMLESNIIFIL